MKRLLTAHVAALALVLALSAGASATPMNPDLVTWSYNFSPAAPAVTADSNAGAGVTFTNEPTTGTQGSGDIVATALRVFSATVPDPSAVPVVGPDTLTSNGAYKLTLTISNVNGDSSLSGSLTFDGKLSGSFSAVNANIRNKFGYMGQNGWVDNSLQVLTLGSTTFTVSLFNEDGLPFYTPPGPPGASLKGGISAHVTLTTGDVGPSQVPEPSTMLLSALGLSFLGGAAWRKRKPRPAA